MTPESCRANVSPALSALTTSATRRGRVLHPTVCRPELFGTLQLHQLAVNHALTCRISCSTSAAARRRCSPGISPKRRIRIRWIRRMKSGVIDSLTRSPLGAGSPDDGETRLRGIELRMAQQVVVSDGDSLVGIRPALATTLRATFDITTPSTTAFAGLSIVARIRLGVVVVPNNSAELTVCRWTPPSRLPADRLRAWPALAVGRERNANNDRSPHCFCPV
jgi:hypothetical protein